MRKTLYCILLLTTLLRLQAQNTTQRNAQSPATSVPEMTSFAQVNGRGIGTDIAIDKNDNVYIVGYFYGTASFGPVTIFSNGSADIFVAKYNKAGILQWVKGAGEKGYDLGNNVAVDDNGNVYITGHFYGKGNFGSVAKTSHDNDDIFLAKYSTDGNLAWVKWSGGKDFDDGQALAVDKAGNIYLTGAFRRTATFGSITKTSQGQTDIFVAKYNSKGEVVWAHSAEGKKFDIGTRIAVDDNGDVYVTGLFFRTVRFGTKTITSNGKYDMFIAKYDGKGTGCSWVQSLGGVGKDSGRDVAIDGKGNIYVSGYYRKTLKAGALSKTSQGHADVFLAKYNTSNGQLQWLQSAGGAKGDYGQGIVPDNSGNIYMTGIYEGTAGFGSFSRTAKALEDSFVAKYTSSGAVEWVRSGGSINHDAGLGIALDSKGNLFTTGVYAGSALFGRPVRHFEGRSDIFVIRLNK